MILAITSHPIQYQVPLWRKLTEAGIDLEVIFLTKQGLEDTYDPEFGKSFKWDIDLLKGYKYSFAEVNNNPNVNSFLKVRFKKNLKSIIKNKQIDAVWIQGWQLFAYWQIVLQASWMGIPVWIRAESNDLRPTKKLKSLIKYLPMKFLFNKISKFLYIGKGNKRLYKNWDISDDKLAFAPYCIDVDLFKEKKVTLYSKRNEIRKKWNIDLNSFVFIFSGKFIDKKCPQIIIEAAERMSSKNIHILFVGDGVLKTNLLNSVQVTYSPDSFKKIHLEDVNKKTVKASFSGFLNQTEISEAYTVADCLILPSDYGETWGLVVNEAYAHSIPAIVSDRCGCSQDLVEPVEQDFVFKYQDVNSLKNSMELAIKRKGLYIEEIDKINRTYNYSTIVSTVDKLIS